MVGFFVFLGLLFVNEAKAGHSVLDDFETYPDSWTYVGQDMSTTTDEKFSGNQSITSDTSNSKIRNSSFWANSTSGNIAIEVFVDYDVSYECMSWGLNLMPDSGHDGFMIKSEDMAGECKIRISSSTAWENLSDMIYDEWFRLKIEWRLDNSTLTGKYAINEGDWTGWYLPWWGTSYPYVDIIEIRAYGNGYPPIYFDYLISVENCELGKCKFCGTYDECIEAGCFWYYFAWPLIPNAGCVEPYEPDLDECGPFFKCQYCLTEVLCEAELNCEWANKGFGDRCYMLEPEIPPEQVGWEAPDCSGYSGFEKFMCEAFMPTQEKIDELFETIGNVKTKFPFNYLGAFSTFFENIKNDLNSTTTIPFKILENEGEVDFTFWEATTTIGGVPEAFKDIVKVFTSTIIVIVWLVWVISFLKRFL